MCEPQMNNTLGSILEQEYFSFMYNREMKLTAQELALKSLFDNLDYSRFDSTLSREAKIKPKKMCLAIIYAFMDKAFTYRAMERFFQRNTFIISLFGLDVSVDYSTISRFFNRNMDALHDLFYQLVIRLDEEGELGKQIVFQDGTKVESRAGRYTFEWKSALEKNSGKCVNRMIKLLHIAKGMKLIDDEREINEDNAVPLLQSLIETLSMTDLDRDTPRGRGHRISRQVRLEEEAKLEMKKLIHMENSIAGIGDKRNSKSRTDADATFMRMKDDHMRNGQLKPAYNIQNAVDSGYVIACTASCDRTDYDTMEPMLREIDENLPWTYSQYCADSGYDCVNKHRILEQKGITDFIKPQEWEISKTRKYNNDIDRYQNMKYDKDKDEFTCANGKKIVFVHTSVNKKHGTVSHHYECKRGCVTCPLRKECMKTSKKKYKQFSAVVEHWQYNKKCFDRLKSDRGIEVRLNRSIMVEGSFAQIKSNMGFDRFNHFSRKKILTVWLILAMAMNTMHFASRHFEQGISGSPQWYKPPEDTSA